MYIKQNVIMTLKKQSGNKILFLLVVLSLNSCSSTRKFANYNFFNGSEYYNDTLSINGQFFGDIKFYSPENVKRKHLKKISKDVSYKNLLVYGKATSSPRYEVFMFFTNNKGNNNLFDATEIVTNDSINNIVLFKRHFTQNNVFVLIKSIGKHKSNTSIMQDAKSIINSMSITKKNRKELSYSDIFNTYKNEDNLLFVLDKFKNAPIERNKKNDWIKLQYLLTILSVDNEYPLYKKEIDDFEKNRKIKLAEIIKNVITNDSSHTDGIKEIIKNISDNEKVVMLNEMHWKPKHRLLAYKLLKPLKEKGFKYLAVEAVDKNKDSSLNERGYPIKSTGYYTREPYFGLFLRKAHDLGYTIIGYDDFDSDNREYSQAENIKSIVEADKNAKIFVYAGIDHIIEDNNNSLTKRMAQYLKELTSVNPLTIDQVELVSNDTKSILLESELFDNEKKINNNVDYFFINNMNASLSEIYKKADLKRYDITDKVLSPFEGKEVFVSVYISKEYEKYKSSSVAIIKKIKLINENYFYVDIPKGNFTLIVKDKANNQLIKREINNP